MRWFRKGFFWASVGCAGLGAAVPGEARGQGVAPRAPAAGVVSLGRPMPLTHASEVRAANLVAPRDAAPSGLQQASFTIIAPKVRAAREEPDDDLLRIPEPAAKADDKKAKDGDKDPKTLEVRTAGPLPPGLSVIERRPATARTSIYQTAAQFREPAALPSILERIALDERGRQARQGGESIVVDELLQAPRWWVSAEYLHWWTRGYNLPPLVTTSPATVPQAQQGVLGLPTTTVLFGGDRTDFGPSSGARIMAGYNFDPCFETGVEAAYFFLAKQDDRFVASSNQFPVLARPFTRLPGVPDRELVASPGLNPGEVLAVAGTITIDNFSELWGAEANFRRVVRWGCDYRIDALAGFRYLDLHEGLTIREDQTVLRDILDPAGAVLVPAGTTVVNTDSFQTRNQFYGGQLGARGQWQRGRWSLDARAKVALGVTNSTIDIAGSQVFNTPGVGVQTFNGGLLALPSNIGRHTDSRFSVVPEVGIKLGYDLTDYVRVYVGYDFLYWSSVMRPGDQIDTTLNAALIPNFTNDPAIAPPGQPIRPVVPFRASDFIAHGLNVGLAIRY